MPDNEIDLSVDDSQFKQTIQGDIALAERLLQTLERIKTALKDTSLSSMDRANLQGYAATTMSNLSRLQGSSTGAAQSSGISGGAGPTSLNAGVGGLAASTSYASHPHYQSWVSSQPSFGGGSGAGAFVAGVIAGAGGAPPPPHPGVAQGMFGEGGQPNTPLTPRYNVRSIPGYQTPDQAARNIAQEAGFTVRSTDDSWMDRYHAQFQSPIKNRYGIRFNTPFSRISDRGEITAAGTYFMGGTGDGNKGLAEVGSGTPEPWFRQRVSDAARPFGDFQQPNYRGVAGGLAYGGARLVADQLNYSTQQYLSGGDNPMARAGTSASAISTGIGAIVGLATMNPVLGFGAAALSNTLLDPLLKNAAAPEESRQKANIALQPFFGPIYGRQSFAEVNRYTGDRIGTQGTGFMGLGGHDTGVYDTDSRLQRLVNRTDRTLPEEFKFRSTQNAAPILGAIGATLFNYGIDPFAPGELVNDPASTRPYARTPVNMGNNLMVGMGAVPSSSVRAAGKSSGGGGGGGGGGQASGTITGGPTIPGAVKDVLNFADYLLGGAPPIAPGGVPNGTLVQEPDRNYRMPLPGGGYAPMPSYPNLVYPGRSGGGTPAGRPFGVVPLPMGGPVQAPGISGPGVIHPQMGLENVPGGPFQENRMETYFRRTGMLFGKEGAASAWQRMAPGFDPYLGGNRGDEPGNIADVLGRLGAADTLAYLRIHNKDLSSPVDPALLSDVAGLSRANARAVTLGGLRPMGSGAAQMAAFNQERENIARLPGGRDSIAFAEADQGFRSARMTDYSQRSTIAFGIPNVQLQGEAARQELLPFNPGGIYRNRLGIIANNRGQIGRVNEMLQNTDLTENERYQLTSERESLRTSTTAAIATISEGFENRLPALSAGRPSFFGRMNSLQGAALNLGRMGVPIGAFGAIGGAHRQMQLDFIHDMGGYGAGVEFPYSRTSGINNPGSRPAVPHIMGTSRGNAGTSGGSTTVNTYPGPMHGAGDIVPGGSGGGGGNGGGSGSADPMVINLLQSIDSSLKMQAQNNAGGASPNSRIGSNRIQDINGRQAASLNSKSGDLGQSLARGNIG